MVEYKAVFNGKRRSAVGKGYKGITWEPLKEKQSGRIKVWGWNRILWYGKRAFMVWE